MSLLHGTLLLCAFILFTSSAWAQNADPFDLKKYRWQNRLLIVFAEDDQAAAYKTHQKEVEELRDEFEDRDMVFISVLEQGTSTAGDTVISTKDAAQLRQSFQVQPGAYRVFLIGKDGGIKREGGPEIQLTGLFALIDTMPMRRSEMRRKSNH